MASTALLLAGVVVAGCAVGLSDATDHIVGANHGWNPNINYSLWSANHTFYVGDLISFRYQKGTHNVFEVDETGHDNYTMAGAAGNWTFGKDFIKLPEPRRRFFICGNGFCQAGMKVAVTVRPLHEFDLGPDIVPNTAPAAAASSSFTAGAWLAAAVAALGVAILVV